MRFCAIRLTHWPQAIGLMIAFGCGTESDSGTSGDDDIRVARSTDGGVTWTAPAALNSDASTEMGDDGEAQVATDAAFNNVVRTEHLPGPTALDLEDLQIETMYYWRVRSENPGGFSPWSDAFSFTTADLMFENLGPLLLADGTPAFVEVTGPGGADPCSPGATSTDGCADDGGNLVRPNGGTRRREKESA